MTAPTWDPEQYLRYADERGRPFADLLARVGAVAPAYVVDLGCGPGTLTRTLVERWPGAEVVGVDSSAEMIARARVDGAGVSFVEADLREWRPAWHVDVLVSNATLQWVPGHLDLVPRLVGMLAPGGWLAVQVPANFDEPSHVLLHEVAADPRWRDGLVGVARPSSHGADTYLRVLSEYDCTVDAWETTYFHVLPGEDAVLRWMLGTGARPILRALPEALRPAFLADYAARLREAYPPTPAGTVLRYRRVFLVARRDEDVCPESQPGTAPC
ncbi:MAG: methyltransferase domain-containing protein [Actinomycetota bacterium]|nr:methyltransferase domain-containing protein [Actinomycetota bacterium]